MKPIHRGLWVGTTFTVLALTHGAAGHALIVDVDIATPGIQSSISVLPGTPVAVDIYVVDDGTGTLMTGYGIATNFNDTPGVLAISTPTVAGPLAGTIPTPFDLAAGVPTGPGAFLAPIGLAPFGFGPGGAFTASNGGTGYYDATAAPTGPTIPFALPGFLGGTALLETIGFTAVGPIGSASDIAPLGILVGGPPPGALPPIFGPGGVEFYDDSAGAPGGLGGYLAAPTGPIPPGPAFPAGVPGGLGPVTPGTIFIIPEPRTFLFGVLTTMFVLLRRRR